MYFLLGLIALFFLYFFSGAILKFVWGWAGVILGTIFGVGLLIAGMPVLGLLILFLGIGITDKWQGSSLYLRVEEKIDKAFYFKD